MSTVAPYGNANYGSNPYGGITIDAGVRFDLPADRAATFKGSAVSTSFDSRSPSKVQQ